MPAKKTTRRKPPAPSKKKSLGYYAKVNKKGGTGKKAGGGMTAKGVAKYRKDNPGSKLKTAVTTPPSNTKCLIRQVLEKHIIISPIGRYKKTRFFGNLIPWIIVSYVRI